MISRVFTKRWPQRMSTLTTIDLFDESDCLANQKRKPTGVRSVDHKPQLRVLQHDGGYSHAHFITMTTCPRLTESKCKLKKSQHPLGVNSLSFGRWLIVTQRYNAQATIAEIKAAMIGCEATMISCETAHIVMCHFWHYGHCRVDVLTCCRFRCRRSFAF